MVCKKDVVTWFKNLKSYQRVDVMNSLLQQCVPFEVRFLGTCLEDLAKKDYQDLRQTEIEANSLSELNSSEVQSITNQETRTKLALYISLLHSSNDACCNKIFNILTKDDMNSVLSLAMTDDLVLEELLSIFTLVLNHPAFSFNQKIVLEKIFCKLQEEESRLSDHVKSKQQMQSSCNVTANSSANYSHSSLTENIHERLPQPVQSYQHIDEVQAPYYPVTNAGPCTQLPPSLHPLSTKPYVYGVDGIDERRIAGTWSGALPCDNGPIIMRSSTLSAPTLDPSGSPLLGARVVTLPQNCDQSAVRVTNVPAPCETLESPLMGSRVPNPSDVVTRVTNQPPPCDQVSTASPLVSRNSSPCQSPSRPSTPPIHRLSQNPQSSHSPPPRQTNLKDQTKDIPAPNVPIDQLSRMNDEELREVGLTPNVIMQLRSLNKSVSNGLPPPQPLLDYRKKTDMILRSMEGYPGGVTMGPPVPVPCCLPPTRPKYTPMQPQVYQVIDAIRGIRLEQESNSSASDTASDHSPPDTPGPDHAVSRRVHQQPPNRPHRNNTHHNPINQGILYRRRDNNSVVNGCDDRKVFSGDGNSGYYSPAGASHPHWPTQYMRPTYPAPHFAHFVPPQPRPPQPFYNGDVMYQPYAYQPYLPPPHLQAKISCYNCGSPSHVAVDCSESTMEEMTNQGQYKIDYTKSSGSSQQNQSQITSPTSPSGDVTLPTQQSQDK